MRKRFVVLLIAAVLLVLSTTPAAAVQSMNSSLNSGTMYRADKPADNGDTFELYDNNTGISAEVNRQVLDAGAFDSLRDYYNDKTLSEPELYRRFFELKKSYINALQARYNTNYMDPDQKAGETAMKIWYEGTEALYGLQNCNIYLYNIIQYMGPAVSELTHLDLVIPDKSRNAVITIKFRIPGNKMAASPASVGSMLSGLRFEGLPVQTKAPAVLSDREMTDRATLGIYPAASQKNPEYTTFENPDASYTVLLPATYVPFVQNSLGGVFSYTSFKLNPNILFSISAEPLQGSGMSDALMRFKVTTYGTVQMKENRMKKFGRNEYACLSYASTSNGLKQYYSDYYLQKGNKLFKLQLQSNLAEPGNNVNMQMSRILSSFNPGGSGSAASSGQTSVSVSPSLNRYLNSEEGYSFSYPQGWRLEDVSKDIAYDRLRIVVPGLSGALDISIQESGLKQVVTFNDIVKSVNGKSVSSWPNLATNYEPPFKDRISKLLCSDFSINGAISTIYRLSVFMDENGRNRLCYSVDIIKNRKLYSMFITAGEYRTESGKFVDSRVNDLINTVAASFRPESTPESEARRISGETRNRKLVMVENYLRQIIDPKLSITSAGSLQTDGTCFVTVGNSSENGFYKVKPDYTNKQVVLMSSVLKRSILNNEISKLKERFQGRYIIRATQNEANMTIAIESLENGPGTNVTRTFKVNAYTDGSDVKWQTSRLAKQDDYMWECENFIKTMLSYDVKVFYEGSNVFTDMEPYKQKGTEYRLMTYVESARVSGFLVLSTDPESGLFSTVGGFLSLESLVEGIRDKYGIRYLSRKQDAIRFDPKTFRLTLRTADRTGTDTQIEQYSIRYNLDKRVIEYKNIY